MKTSFSNPTFLIACLLAGLVNGSFAESSARDLMNMASATADAIRETREQNASSDAAKAIFAKAKEEEDDGNINFCGFFAGMPKADADTLISHYGLKEGEYTVKAIPESSEVYELTFTLRSVRRITKGGNSFDELSQAVANRVGTMKPVHDDDYKLKYYEYKTIDGVCARMSESAGFVLTDPTREEAVKIQTLLGWMVDIPGKNYKMCKYECTQALWEAFMGSNPSKFKDPDRPVECVSWNDCQKFLEKLNANPDVKKTGLVFRLPTSWEWAYACRAGSAGRYCKLADGTEITKQTLGLVAWYGNNSTGRTHPVGLRMPNAFGLYDMCGNVSEWTSTDEDGERVFYGYSWTDDADSLERYSIAPGRFGHDLGFRLVASAGQ